MKVVKYGAQISVSEEMLFHVISSQDERYRRKISEIKTRPVSEESRTEYEKAKEALAFLQSYEGFSEGGPDYGAELTEPVPEVEVIYAETTAEWLDRCRVLRTGGAA